MSGNNRQPRRLDNKAAGVSLLNLNWGYQVLMVRPQPPMVLSAIKDTQDGPHRSQKCRGVAMAEFERIARIFNVSLTDSARRLLATCVAADGAWVDYAREGYAGNTVNVLVASGLAERGVSVEGKRKLVRLVSQYVSGKPEGKIQ